MALILNDNFTDTAGTSLVSHTPDSGGSYTRVNGSIALSIAASGTALDLTAASAVAFYHSAVPATADYDVTGVFLRDGSATGSNAGFTGRQDTVANTSYWVRYTGTTVALIRFVAGAATSIGSANVSWATNSSHTAKLRMVGTGLAVDIDGVQVIPATAGTFITDAGIAGPGRAGVRCSASAAHMFLDSLQVNDTSSTGTNYTETGIAAGTILSSQGQSSAQAMSEPNKAAVTVLSSQGQTNTRAMQEIGVPAVTALSTQGQATAQAMREAGTAAATALASTGGSDSIAHGNSYDETGRLAAVSLASTGQTSTQAMRDVGGAAGVIMAVTGGTSTYTPINPPTGSGLIVMLPEFE